jgi:hypothetical protein
MAEASSDEAAWRDLVERYGEAPSAGATVPWPAREDLTVKPTVPPGDPVMGPLTRNGHPAGARIVRPALPEPPASDGEDDGHYVPPPPPPLPSLDPVAKAAWIALFGGPAYLLLTVMAGWPVPGWAAFTAVAAFVGGFATLVVRMGDQPPRDKGSGDGAVV